MTAPADHDPTAWPTVFLFLVVPIVVFWLVLFIIDADDTHLAPGESPTSVPSPQLRY